MTTTDPTEQEIREFSSFLIDMPQTHNEMGAKLNELIAAVRDTGKAGSLTLKIGVRMLSPDDGTALVMTPAVTVTKPKFELKAGVFYADSKNNPRRNDPNQPGLFDESTIRETPNATADAIREVGADTRTGEVKDI